MQERILRWGVNNIACFNIGANIACKRDADVDMESYKKERHSNIFLLKTSKLYCGVQVT